MFRPECHLQLWYTQLISGFKHFVKPRMSNQVGKNPWRSSQTALQHQCTLLKPFVYSSDDSKAKQTRFIASYQPLSKFACEWAALFIIHYQQTLYRTGKLWHFNQHVIGCKAIMTDEAAGFRGCRYSFTYTYCNSTGIKNWPQPQVNLPSWDMAKSPRASQYKSKGLRVRLWSPHTARAYNSVGSKARNTTEKGNQGPQQ